MPTFDPKLRSRPARAAEWEQLERIGQPLSFLTSVRWQLIVRRRSTNAADPPKALRKPRNPWRLAAEGLGRRRRAVLAGSRSKAPAIRVSDPRRVPELAPSRPRPNLVCNPTLKLSQSTAPTIFGASPCRSPSRQTPASRFGSHPGLLNRLMFL